MPGGSVISTAGSVMRTDWVLPYLPLQSGTNVRAWQANVIDYPPLSSCQPEAHPVGVEEARDELWVILAGAATIELDGVAHTVGPGAIVHVPAGVLHRIEAGTTGFRFVAVALFRSDSDQTDRAAVSTD